MSGEPPSAAALAEHAFNARWWGSPVGVVRDAGFFRRPMAERREALARFAWAEFSCEQDAGPDLLAAVADTGFVWADVQIPFRIGLASRAADGTARESSPLVISTAAEGWRTRPGALPVRSFTSERFLMLPGATQARIDNRFRGWAAEICAASPDLCLEFVRGGAVQGWFLSQPDGSGGIRLTLAALADAATCSGMELYRSALQAYARSGFRLGSASFSVRNTAVMSIYAALHARFQAPRPVFLWWPRG
jgi:hypothetical protein